MLKNPAGLVQASLRGLPYGTEYDSFLRSRLAWNKARHLGRGYLGRVKAWADVK